MAIQDRIIQIMQNYGLNSLQFANKLGVQPSNISHILSGRNKPSLDFITKILKTFPDIDYKWLVLNQGAMLSLESLTVKDENKETTKFNNNEPIENKVEGNLDNATEGESDIKQDVGNTVVAENKNVANVANVAVGENKIKVEEKNVEQQPNLFSVFQTIEPQQQIEKEIVQKEVLQPIKPKSKVRSIEKVIVFYDDNTYKEIL